MKGKTGYLAFAILAWAALAIWYSRATKAWVSSRPASSGSTPRDANFERISWVAVAAVKARFSSS